MRRGRGGTVGNWGLEKLSLLMKSQSSWGKGRGERAVDSCPHCSAKGLRTKSHLWKWPELSKASLAPPAATRTAASRVHTYTWKGFGAGDGGRELLCELKALQATVQRPWESCSVQAVSSHLVGHKNSAISVLQVYPWASKPSSLEDSLSSVMSTIKR